MDRRAEGRVIYWKLLTWWWGISAVGFTVHYHFNPDQARWYNVLGVILYYVLAAGAAWKAGVFRKRSHWFSKKVYAAALKASDERIRGDGEYHDIRLYNSKSQKIMAREKRLKKLIKARYESEGLATKRPRGHFLKILVGVFRLTFKKVAR